MDALQQSICASYNPEAPLGLLPALPGAKRQRTPQACIACSKHKTKVRAINGSNIKPEVARRLLSFKK
jgi:hypothetical protein